MRWLIPRLYRFHEAHPAIDVRLSTNDRNIDFPQTRVDMSILVLDGETKPNAKDVVLFSERLGIVLSPLLVQAKGITEIADLDRVTRLTTRTRPNAWSSWQDGVGVFLGAVNPKMTSEYDHYYFAIEAAASGLGACAVPYYLVSDDLAAGRLVAPFGFVETGYRYVARRRRADSKLASPFCAWLKKEAQRQQ